jgi:hypothetical protein
LVSTFEFIIGISSRCPHIDRDRTGQVSLFEHEYDRPFYVAARLDVELVGVTIFDAKHPITNIFSSKNVARTHFPPAEYFPQTVITAPVFEPGVLSEMVKSLAYDRATDGRPPVPDRILEDVVAWRLMLNELHKIITGPQSGAHVRAGFHCETIGFFSSSGENLLASFAEAYEEFIRRLTQQGVIVQ